MAKIHPAADALHIKGLLKVSSKSLSSLSMLSQSRFELKTKDSSK